MALDRLEIDELGLDSNDRRMLEMIIKGYSGGPVGLETLASALGEETVTLEDVCEPYLMQLGFLARTPRGRCATALAYPYLFGYSGGSPLRRNLFCRGRGSQAGRSSHAGCGISGTDTWCRCRRYDLCIP